MTTRTLTTLAGLAAAAITSASIAQPTTSPRTSPSTPSRTTPSTTPRTTPSTPTNQPNTTPTNNQPTNQPNTTPTNQPNTTPTTPTGQPTNNPNIPPTVNDPTVQPVLPSDATQQPIIETPIIPGTTGNLNNANNRVFAVDPQQEARFQQLQQRLARLEAQLQQNNDNILQQLGQARQMADTNTRFDRLAAVVQNSLLQNRILLQYLVEIRTSLTGQIATDNATDGTNTGTGISPDGTVQGQPNQTPSGPGTRTVPGSLQGPTTTSPRSPSVTPTTPGRPTAPVTSSPGSGPNTPTRAPNTTPTTPPATGTPSTSPTTPPR